MFAGKWNCRSLVLQDKCNIEIFLSTDWVIFFCFCCHLLTFFKINVFQKFFQEHYQSVKQFGSRSGPMFCWSLSGSKLFAKVISRQQVTTGKEEVFVCLFCCFTSKVNSYGHGRTVSSPNHTFSWASLNKQLTSTSCTYF